MLVIQDTNAQINVRLFLCAHKCTNPCMTDSVHMKAGEINLWELIFLLRVGPVGCGRQTPSPTAWAQSYTTHQ